MNKAMLTLLGFGLALANASALHAAELATILLPQDQEIQLALEAGPEHLRAAATVYVFGKDGYRTCEKWFARLEIRLHSKVRDSRTWRPIHEEHNRRCGYGSGRVDPAMD
jgi:hypothetical protein